MKMTPPGSLRCRARAGYGCLVYGSQRIGSLVASTSYQTLVQAYRMLESNQLVYLVVEGVS